MVEFSRLVIVTFKIVISVYMVNKTLICEDRNERSKLLVYWSTIGFFALVEYITDKYGCVPVSILFDFKSNLLLPRNFQ